MKNADLPVLQVNFSRIEDSTVGVMQGYICTVAHIRCIFLHSDDRLAFCASAYRTAGA